MNRYFIGIDPGVNGAVSVFHETGEFETVFDLPIIFDNRGKKQIDEAQLYAQLLGYKILRAYIEDVFSSPQMGVTSAFNFGRSVGAIQGVLAASEIPYSLIRPQRWKDTFRLLKKEKDAARDKVISILPGKKGLFKRKKDVDRAESCLICLTGMGIRK